MIDWSFISQCKSRANQLYWLDVLTATPLAFFRRGRKPARVTISQIGGVIDWDTTFRKILVYSLQLFCLISFSCWQNSLGHWKPWLCALTSQWKPTGSYLQWCKDACLNFTHSWNGFQGHLPHEPDTRWDESSTQYFLQSSWKRGVWIGLFRWSWVWRRRAKLPGPCWFSGGLGTRGSCLCPKNFGWNEQIPHRVDSVSFGHLPQEVSCSQWYCSLPVPMQDTYFSIT